MRCTSLSEDAAVQIISERFVAFALNMTADDVDLAVKELPALQHLPTAFTTNWRFAFGFASCVVLSFDGAHVLGFVSASDAKDPLVFKTFLEVCEFL